MMPVLLTLLGAVLGLFAFSRTETGQSVIDQVATPKLPRGIRNNNPGNIDWIADPKKRWDGMVRKETAAEGGRFGVFDSPAMGVRAIGKELELDARRGIRTVAGLINAWAPPTENNTSAYVTAVCRAVKVEPNQVIDVPTYLPRLVAAIVQHENGQQPYSATDIQKWCTS